MLRLLTILGLAATILMGTSAGGAGPSDLPLVFEDDFEQGAAHWQPTDPKA